MKAELFSAVDAVLLYTTRQYVVSVFWENIANAGLLGKKVRNSFVVCHLFFLTNIFNKIFNFMLS